MKAVAVIIREADIKNCALGIGLKEAENKSWCASTSVMGYQSISELYKTSLTDSRQAYEKLVARCTDVTTPGNYPAWEYCAAYGITNNYAAPFNIGWCLPTKTELDSVKANNNDIITGMTKANGTYLKIGSSVKTGIDPTSRSDLKTESYYVTCNQNGSDAYIHNLKTDGSSETLGDKVNGRTSNTSKYITIKLLARPVYHFENNQYSLAQPIISDKSSGKVTINTRSTGATICYKVDNDSWNEAPAPAEVSINGDAHTIYAYTKKAGLDNSKEVNKAIPADPVY